MGKFSKDKGARFERQVAHLFQTHGIDAHRTAQYQGNTGAAGDIEGVPYIHIEAKHQEHMRLYEWMAQSVFDAEAEGIYNLPTVIHKANNKPVLVTMRFEDWMQMYMPYVQSNKTIAKND